MKEIAFGELGLAAKKEKKSNIIKWTETAGIESAGKLKVELQKAIDENLLVFIDLSGLEDIDLTGIQLILAAKKEADAQKKKFLLKSGIPPAILEYVGACGVSFEDLIDKTESKSEESKNA